MASQSYSRRENRISPAANTALTLVFALAALACVLPVLLVVVVSFTASESLTDRGYSFFPSEMTLSAYRTLFIDYTTILHAYGVSIGITAAGTALGVLLMALYAYPLSRRDYPFRGAFMFLLFFTMLFNGGVVSKYMVFMNVLHLKDSFAALLLPLLIVPFNVIIMRTFFQTTIHSALIESAKIDGAGELRIFIRLILPLSLPVMATMALFSTIAYWNDWFNALLFIRSEDKYPLQYLMMRELRDVQYMRDQIMMLAENPEAIRQLPGESMQMAMSVIGMGPILLVYPFFQRYFVKGLTVGAVKG